MDSVIYRLVKMKLQEISSLESSIVIAAHITYNTKVCVRKTKVNETITVCTVNRRCHNIKGT